jgi:protein SCO1/2
VFVTVDPERDGVQQVREYVREFHPRLVGLTGTPSQVREAARAYRVYYSRTASDGDDYLVDHSIITYLLAPDGSFLTFFGKNYTAEEMAAGVATHMAAWHKQHPDWKAKA